MADKEKLKALELAVGQIEKQFGKGSIMKLGEADVSQDVQVVSTGSLGLDIALGVGGLPRGRVVEIYGPESSGKTTLTLQVIAEMQKLSGVCAFIDAEHALDPQYAQKIGVNVQELLISQPDNGEQALEIADMLVRSNAVDVLVVTHDQSEALSMSNRIAVMDGGRIVIVAGVGNKEAEYDESDVRQLNLLMSGMWRILQRKRAEEALQRSEERSRALVGTILHTALEAILVVNEQGAILTINPTADFLANKTYAIRIDSGAVTRPALLDFVRNYAGQGIAREYKWTENGELTSNLIWIYKVQ